MDILSEKENKLLGRRELWALVSHTDKPTPTRTELWEAAAARLKAEKETIVVDKIFSVPKTHTSKVKLFVYAKKTTVPKKMADKMAGIKKGKAPPAGQPAPAGQQKGKKE